MFINHFKGSGLKYNAQDLYTNGGKYYYISVLIQEFPKVLFNSVQKNFGMPIKKTQ